MSSARVQLGDIDVHTAVVGPVVRERDNETDPVSLRGRDDGVKARDTVVTRVERSNTV